MDIATLDRSTASVDQLTVADLVAAASAGDERAWEEIVVRFQPIIRSVSRRYRLSYEEGADVSQSLWLKLTSHLGDLREPAALPGWIKTTASRLAMATVEARRRVVPTQTPRPRDPTGPSRSWSTCRPTPRRRCCPTSAAPPCAADCPKPVTSTAPC